MRTAIPWLRSVLSVLTLALVGCGGSSIAARLERADRMASSSELSRQIEAVTIYDQAAADYSRVIGKSALLKKRVAIRLVRDRKFLLALEYLRGAEKVFPDDPEIYYYSGISHINLARLDESHLDRAAESYRKAIELNPEYMEAVYGLAVVRIEQGDVSGTKELLQRCLRLKPDYVPALKMRGNLQYNEGNLAGAASSYEKALSFVPEGSEDALVIHKVLGKIYMEGKNWKKAGQHYRKVLELVKFDQEAQEALEKIKGK